MFSHDVKRQASPSWIYAPAITSIMYETFEVTPFKRNYDAAFGKIANIELVVDFGLRYNQYTLKEV
jgi:hypothetical protein